MKLTAKNRYKIVITFLIITLMNTSAFASADVNENKFIPPDEKPTMIAGSEERVSVTLHAGSYDIKNTAQGHEIAVENFGRLLIPGKPNLPSKIFSVAIPPGAEVTDVSFDVSEGIIIPGAYQIQPTPLPRVLGQEDPLIYERNKKTYETNFNFVYGNDEPYPQKVGEFIRRAGYRKYNLVDVRITPFTYQPKSCQLVYHPEVTVHVSYNLLETTSAGEIMVDNLARTERTARDIIINYEQAQNWYPVSNTVGGKGLHDFVIITLDSLTSVVTPLVDWETAKGRTVQVVTTSWIDSNYQGVDLAQKMRNFLRDKYPSEQWGIEDVLLVGFYDNVPMRRTWQDLGYGMPETDFYYAELSLPDNQSWDADEDEMYGEDGDDPIDFYSEINVGRIPWISPGTVKRICTKSVLYEQNNDLTFKNNILLLGAYFWPDTDNAVLMEYKVNSTFHPWMSNWTMTRMYEKNTDYWSTYDCDYPLLNSNVMSVWPTGKYAFVNWAGHGSPVSSHIYGLGMSAFIRSSDCPSLNDDYPAIIFADACSNSDTDHLSIGQSMIKRGGVGFLGATKVAYGMGAWEDPYDGSSQSLDYFFTTCVTSGDYTQGEAHQWALREMYTHGLWYDVKYETFEWGALWGNPDLKIGVSDNDPPETPNQPGGSVTGEIGLEHTFCVDGVVDPEGDDVYYKFSWGDGDVTEWLGPYPSGVDEICASHTWTKGKDYNIKVEAKDIHGYLSSWSEPLLIHVTAPELKIGEVTSGIGKIYVDIKNIGDAGADDVKWRISVKGGIQDGINVTTEYTIDNLEVDDVEQVYTNTFILGFGRVKITITAEADYADKVTKTANGFVFLFLMLGIN